jgi:hypothetical protein
MQRVGGTEPIVNAHGGSIGVQSEAGAGTTFTRLRRRPIGPYLQPVSVVIRTRNQPRYPHGRQVSRDVQLPQIRVLSGVRIFVVTVGLRSPRQIVCIADHIAYRAIETSGAFNVATSKDRVSVGVYPLKAPAT